MAMLTATKVKTLKHSGETKTKDTYCDQNGLMLWVHPAGAKSWVQRVTLNGKRIAVGLGGWPAVSLAEARETALANRRRVRNGEDPRKRTAAAVRQAARSNAPDFRTLAEEVVNHKARSWEHAKTPRQWRQSLEAYAYPVIGNLAVDAVDAAHVLAILEPIWHEKPVTAGKVRRRISAVMLRAKVKGWRDDDPAGMELVEVLGASRSATKHHKAIHYSLAGDAVRKMRDSNASTATKLLFEFLVLTAARSGEARGATWDEVDLEGATWTVPAERMKARREHRVPLAPRCLALLRAARSMPRKERNADSPLVFPSPTGKVLSDNTLPKLLKEHGIDATAHGFRSTFRDWAGEQTETPHAVMEAALAHAIKNKAEAAYARSDLFAKRRELMERWAAFVAEGNPA